MTSAGYAVGYSCLGNGGTLQGKIDHPELVALTSGLLEDLLILVTAENGFSDDIHSGRYAIPSLSKNLIRRPEVRLVRAGLRVPEGVLLCEIVRVQEPRRTVREKFQGILEIGSARERCLTGPVWACDQDQPRQEGRLILA